jgi:hypothetical protein
VWMVGVPEILGGVAVMPGVIYPPDYHELMISNGFMIARRNNAFLDEVHRMQNQDLDLRATQLQSNPPPDSGRCCQDDPKGYPIRWAELLGELMAMVGQKYYTHFRRVILSPHLNDYI